jgi:hypothetical protein
MVYFAFKNSISCIRSRDSSFGIATGYGMEGRGSIPSPAHVSDFSLLYSVQISSGAHPDSYPVSIGGLTVHHHVVSSSRMVELYLDYAIRLYGLVFS